MWISALQISPGFHGEVIIIFSSPELFNHHFLPCPSTESLHRYRPHRDLEASLASELLMCWFPQTLQVLSFGGGFGLILHAIIILWLFATGFLNSRNNIPETLRWAENHCCHLALSHRSVRETNPTFVLGTLVGHWQKKLGLLPCTGGHTTKILNSQAKLKQQCGD